MESRPATFALPGVTAALLSAILQECTACFSEATVRGRHRLFGPSSTAAHSSSLSAGSPYAGRMSRPADTTRLASLRSARDLIDRDFATPVDVTALAAQAGYSRYHFIRAFRAAYGATPGDYLSRRRVERACELLRTVNLTVTEVCFLVGFSSLGSFSSRFSELIGCSPSEYQRRAAESGGPPPVPGCMVLMWGSPQPTVRNRGEAAGPGAPVASGPMERTEGDGT